MIRIVPLLTVCIATFVNPQNILCAKDSGTEEESTHNLDTTIAPNESKGVAALKKQLLETKAFLANKRPADYAFVMGNALREAAKSPIGSSKPGKKLIREYAKTVFNADIGEPPIAKSLDVQLRLYLETFAHEPLNVEELSEDDVESITLLLQLWNHSRKMEEYYSEFDSLNPSDEWRQKLDFAKIISSYHGPFGSGMPPEAIKDPKIREDYRTYLNDRTKFQKGSWKREIIARPGRTFRIRAARYLAEQFGDGPMDENLASLIRKHQPQHFEGVQKSIQDQIKLLKELDAWQPPKR